MKRPEKVFEKKSAPRKYRYAPVSAQGDGESSRARNTRWTVPRSGQKELRPPQSLPRKPEEKREGGQKNAQVQGGTDGKKMGKTCTPAFWQAPRSRRTLKQKSGPIHVSRWAKKKEGKRREKKKSKEMG